MKRNTQAIVQMASEKSRQARLRVVVAISTMQSDGTPINFNTIRHAARVSKTFLYDPKHADLAEQIRSLRRLHPETERKTTGAGKSDSAKDFRSPASKSVLERSKTNYEHSSQKTKFSTANLHAVVEI